MQEYGLEALVSPFGVVADVQHIHPPRGLASFNQCLAFSGIHLPSPDADPETSTHDERPRGGRTSRPGTVGYGMAFEDPAKARTIAIAEAAERYSAGDFQRPLMWASYRDLRGRALEISRIPRCSPRELASPGCTLRPLRPDDCIRWASGVELTTGEQIWVPAVMAFYGLDRPVPAEGFWYRISTGYAVHTDTSEAVVRGICEVVERDALAITWLQQLRLPTVGDGTLSHQASGLLSWAERHFIDIHLFDATTDLGVPTVICLHLASHDRQCAQLVSCSTGRSMSAAVDKALLEACRARAFVYPDEDLPESFADFVHFADGSRYMARPERAAAFDFLLRGADERIADEPGRLPEEPAAALEHLIGVLRTARMPVVAVDSTTTELADIGLASASVIIPDLQPMTLLPGAQYRAHPRLYSLPVRMGYSPVPEEELNPWPLPYA